jgi:hypothetical protein
MDREGGKTVEIIQLELTQKAIDQFANEMVYIHLETTNGAYANHNDENFFSSGAYIRNAHVQLERGKITGPGPFRVGIKIPLGWIYAEGITHYTIDEKGRLLMAGHDFKGKLAVALEISRTPFE